MFSTGEPQEEVATLDNYPAKETPSMRRTGCRLGSVHAENEGSPAVEVELGLGQRQIARSCGMGLGTVHDYLERAAAAGIGWPLPAKRGAKRNWKPSFAGTNRFNPSGEAAAATGLEKHSVATATASPSDTAVSVGRIPADASRGISLQLVLRALSALAAAPGCGAASGTQSR